MKLFRLTKFIVLSATLSHTRLFADTYNLQVRKDGETVTFRVLKETEGIIDTFSVKRVDGAYEIVGAWALRGLVENMTIGTDLEFDVGEIHVFYDTNDRIQLSNGCLQNDLWLQSANCPVVVEKGKTLTLGTFVVNNVDVFKNEGTTEAFVTLLSNCKTAENKGNFRSRNLFLSNADIQNYGIISWNDAFKSLNGKIIPKLSGANRGYVKMENKTGNTCTLYGARGENRLVAQFGKGYCNLDFFYLKEGSCTIVAFTDLHGFPSVTCEGKSAYIDTKQVRVSMYELFKGTVSGYPGRFPDMYFIYDNPNDLTVNSSR